MSKPRSRLHDDSGATLILALIVVTTIALVVGAVLTRSDGAIRATVGLRQVAGSTYSADAAAQVAINNLRTGHWAGSDTKPSGWAYNNVGGDGCFGRDNNAGVISPKNSVVLSDFYPAATSSGGGATSAYVECAAEDATGAQGALVPINNSNKPGYAIVTLGGPITTSGTLRVHGGVYTNGTISGPVEIDEGGAWATGPCTQTVATPKNCNIGASIPDPNYTNELGGSVPALQKPPTSCTSGVAIFDPGYYDDAAALNTASALCSTMWFKPGTYYFDFHNSSCGTYCPSTLYGSQSSSTGNIWTIPRGKSVIGGRPTNAGGTVLASPPGAPTVSATCANTATNFCMPGSCQSPIDSTSAVGVQFVFGGDSRMYLAGGGSDGAHMELCGTYYNNKPPVLFYGLKNGGSLSSTTASGLVPSGAVDTTQSSGTWTNANAAAVSAVGGNAATWTTTGNGTKTATITVRGHTPGSTIPAGAILTGASLQVTHKEAGTATTATLQVNGASSPTAAVTLPLRATSGTDTITFNATTNAAVFATLQQQVHDYGFSGATTVYSARVTTNGNNTVTFDASSLDLTYALPVLRGESGTCVATGTSCPLLSLDSTGNNKIVIYLQGTTYAPSAYFDFTLSNFSAEVAKFGIVGRQLAFAINNGNPRYVGPVFQIPDNSPGWGFSGTLVQLKVYLCPNSSTCSAGAGKLSLTSRVQVWDPTGVPVPSQRQISVLSWSHQR